RSRRMTGGVPDPICDTTRVRPTYCRRCGRNGPGDQHLCPECGDTLVEQGFCPICERPWRQPVGSPCPKHEIELISVDDVEPVATDRARWVTVATFADGLQAEPPRIRLESEGIPTLLQGERMGSLSMYQ